MSDSIMQHLAIVMDGNSRWAQQRNKLAHYGHEYGAQKLVDVVRWIQKLGVANALSVFAFSRENWQRPKREIDHLMRLFGEFLDSYKDRLVEQDICLRIVGDKSALQQDLQDKIADIEKLSQEGNFCLNIAVNYSGQWDMIQACNRALEDKVLIDENTIAQRLLLPKADLLIRTGREKRISNFMLWQIAYAEIYFIDDYWPDFEQSHLDSACQFYSKRSRRFGGR